MYFAFPATAQSTNLLSSGSAAISLKSHNGDCPFCDTSELIAQTGTKLTFLTNASLDESA